MMERDLLSNVSSSLPNRFSAGKAIACCPQAVEEQLSFALWQLAQ